MPIQPTSPFYFTATEKKGILALLFLMLLLLIIRILLPIYFLPSMGDEKAALQALDNMEFKIANLPVDSFSYPTNPSHFYTKNKNTNKAQPAVAIHLQPFNPNTATFAQLLQLGLDARAANTLLKFREKGWDFRYKQDIQRIYGISPELYTTLEPYISLPNKPEYTKKEYPKTPHSYTPHANNYPTKYQPYTPNTTSHPTTTAIRIDLNRTDTSLLQSLRGIGSTLATRILKYKELLGGYTSINQLKEVWGITDQNFELIASQVEVVPTEIKKIPINTIAYNELKKHPYFKELGVKIMYIRNKKGKIDGIQDLVEEGISTLEIEKILPYIQF